MTAVSRQLRAAEDVAAEGQHWRAREFAGEKQEGTTLTGNQQRAANSAQLFLVATR